MRHLSLGTHRSGGNECLGILDHGEPIEMLPEEIEVSSKARVTGKQGGVSPLEDPRADQFRDKHPVGCFFRLDMVRCASQTFSSTCHIAAPPAGWDRSSGL